MQLKVITPDKGIQIDKEVCLVEAEGQEGCFGILENHIAFITPLKKTAFLKYQSKNNTPVQELNLQEGILEVSKEKSKTVVKVIASKVLN